MLSDKKNILKIGLILIVSLTYFQNVFGIVTDEIVEPPHPSPPVITCPPWKSIAQHLDISNVKIISPRLFNIEIRGIVVNIEGGAVRSRIWSAYIKNIAATSQEEALTKTKNILGTLPTSRLGYGFSPASSSYYYEYAQCVFSDDIFMYSI